MPTRSFFREITAEQAAEQICDGDALACSGFTPAGAAKAVPRAIAERAARAHQNGEDLRIKLYTGASTGCSLDGALAAADAVSLRMPYQSNLEMRIAANEGRIGYIDHDLSTFPQNLRYGHLGRIACAVIEACRVDPGGRITVTTSVGASPTFCRLANRIIIELNEYHPAALHGLHDLYEPEDPPHRGAIDIYRPDDRIGEAAITVDPDKIVGIVRTNQPDEIGGFSPQRALAHKIGENVAEFLAAELRDGRIPSGFLPLQSGVGDLANSVLLALGNHPGIPNFSMYSEVLQDAAVCLIEQGKILFASGCSLTLSPEMLGRVYERLEMFKHRIVLRPQEISNNPEVIRRLGVISVNTALEMDLLGNVNSTHRLGREVVNGIGGSGDFARSARYAIFACPSISKGGGISTIVPFVTHVDHNEHFVGVMATEQGVADLRGVPPRERARLIVEKCAHPSFRDDLRRYLELADKAGGRTPYVCEAAGAMHRQFMQTGTMHGVDWDTAFVAAGSGPPFGVVRIAGRLSR